MWDELYSEAFDAYGETPNDFLQVTARRIPTGPVLVLAAGEGRDAVFLAELGYQVTAMDQSKVGIANANILAAKRSVSIETVVADLADFEFGESRWAGIVSIWAHVPPPLRRRVHNACESALMTGGVFILEAYAPGQLDAPGKGGPPMLELLMPNAEVQKELGSLNIELCQEAHRDIHEGTKHVGPSVTTQILASKP